MKRLFIIILFISPFLFNCATGPPARIEDGRYINPKFEYSIQTPIGWQVSEKLPKWLKNEMPFNAHRLIRVVFLNNDINGIIGISSEKTVFDLSVLDSKQLKDVFVKKCKKQKEVSEKNPYIKEYDYEIHDSGFWSNAWYEPQHIVTHKFCIQTEFQKIKGESRSYLYNCRTDDTCSMEIFLVSDVKTFDENYPVFEAVINSRERQKR